ncbi:MAG: hypothetical protein H7Y27_11025, partial [Gemmatimonadaceae bacterium]|nr:hypothetical protein [Chitinophagaceae bacterium]
MAVAEDKKVISKRNEGFPEWLDFEKLRREGIDYLGELSGKIWTDHNVHDPGITILETLCYALLDLGYRTSLPSKDLFAPDPESGGVDDNFLTPASILGCNPVTITDYRKLLVDIRGVKNAWLEVAEQVSPSIICDRPGQGYDFFLNGLYQVYLDLESEVADKNAVVDTVRSKLMSHRNLCEDFLDIIVLEKQRIGVCADIEIDNSTDPGQLYLAVIENLRTFLSPSPKFYRLNQLLEEKKRPIEDVFAGRPYDLNESHGFVDLEEFEAIKLRKEIHVSDVYNVLYNIKGITAVKNIRFQNCDGNLCFENNNPWVFKIFKDHVAELGLECSGFRFLRNGVNVLVDFKKYNDYLKLNFSNNGKNISQYDSLNLNLPVPTGAYRRDMAEYYPLENDFPKVYGIADGSLPDDITPERKAKSLQLRGYLLFFDHLLSGYLSQLKNIRSLFAVTETGKEPSHTYFVNQIADWPGLDKLVRFDLSSDQKENFGNTLAFPVDKKLLEKLIASGINDCDFEKNLEPLIFCSAAERDLAVHLLMEEMRNGSVSEKLQTNAKGCTFFYFYPSSGQFAMVGRGEYNLSADAEKAMSSLKYLATDKSSYRKYSSEEGFSFQLGAGNTGYWKFLQQISEDEILFSERRNLFLDHLLARFAEKFTDYALLSYAHLDSEEIAKKNINFKQHFLREFPKLSSERGRAYDYSVNGWDNTNISGLEKRFGAYIGNTAAKRENLCHFEVTEYEEQSVALLSWSGSTFFDSAQSFENRDAAKQTLTTLLKELQNPQSIKIVSSGIDNNFLINVNAGGADFVFPTRFGTHSEALSAKQRLQGLFSLLPRESDIEPVKYQHEMVVVNRAGDRTWKKNDLEINHDKQFALDPLLLETLADAAVWQQPEGENVKVPELKLVHDSVMMDFNGFELDVNRVDVKNQVILYQFTLNDLEKRFFFISSQVFGSRELAHEKIPEFLFFLSAAGNMDIQKNESGEFIIYLDKDGERLATNTVEYASYEDAVAGRDLIAKYASDHLYYLKTNTSPNTWRYIYQLHDPYKTSMVFEGESEYTSADQAMLALSKLDDRDSRHSIRLAGESVSLHDEKGHVVARMSNESEATNAASLLDEAKSMFAMRQSMKRLSLEGDNAELEKMVVPDRQSREGNYGYLLVKKDAYYASFVPDAPIPAFKDRFQIVRELFTEFSKGLQVTRICQGGNNVRERKNPVDGKTWYHFLIR